MMRPPVVVPELIVTLLVTPLIQVMGHGRLWEPPSRSSMWRRGYNSPVNYQDMELFCGGVGVQYGVNGGKCGVCGDPWNGPRHNEGGGEFAKGIIVRKYDIGQIIRVVIDLTANHKGYFEFNICPTNNPFAKVTEECLTRYPLAEVTTGKVQYPVPDIGYSGMISLDLRLPAGVRCRGCLLRWKYTAGNSWGTNPDGVSCIGCGNQEQFYGCADIAIGHDDVVLGKPADRPQWRGDDTTVSWETTVLYDNTTTDGASTCLYTHNGLLNVVFLALFNFVLVLIMTSAAS